MLESCTFDIDDKVKDKIEKIAKDNYRSLSAQIRMILEEYVEDNK